MFFFNDEIFAQKDFKIGFNLNPIYSFTSNNYNIKQNPENHFIIRGNLSFSSGINFTYNFTEKLDISTGIKLVKKGFIIKQTNFDGFTKGFINHKPIYHTTEIPFCISYNKIKNDKLNLKYSCGITLDITNFDSYKIRYKLKQTPDTLTSFANYSFNKFFSTSLIGSIKIESKKTKFGIFEYGLSFSKSLKRFSTINVNTNIGNIQQFEVFVTPKLNYIGLDLCYYTYNGKSMKDALSFNKPTIYLIIIQAIILSRIIL